MWTLPRTPQDRGLFSHCTWLYPLLSTVMRKVTFCYCTESLEKGSIKSFFGKIAPRHSMSVVFLLHHQLHIFKRHRLTTTEQPRDPCFSLSNFVCVSKLDWNRKKLKNKINYENRETNEAFAECTGKCHQGHRGRRVRPSQWKGNEREFNFEARTLIFSDLWKYVQSTGQGRCSLW